MKTILLFFIKCYRICFSPLFPHVCRHEPSCSVYSFQAIQEYGVMKGIYLTVKRLSKCHPWGTYGYDPVPSHKKSLGEL